MRYKTLTLRQRKASRAYFDLKKIDERIKCKTTKTALNKHYTHLMKLNYLEYVWKYEKTN